METAAIAVPAEGWCTYTDHFNYSCVYLATLNTTLYCIRCIITSLVCIYYVAASLHPGALEHHSELVWRLVLVVTLAVPAARHFWLTSKQLNGHTVRRAQQRRAVYSPRRLTRHWLFVLVIASVCTKVKVCIRAGAFERAHHSSWPLRAVLQAGAGFLTDPPAKLMVWSLKQTDPPRTMTRTGSPQFPSRVFVNSHVCARGSQIFALVCINTAFCLRCERHDNTRHAARARWAGEWERVENEMKGWMGLTPLPNYIITRELVKNTSFHSAERRPWRVAEP